MFHLAVPQNNAHAVAHAVDDAADAVRKVAEETIQTVHDFVREVLTNQNNVHFIKNIIKHHLTTFANSIEIIEFV